MNDRISSLGPPTVRTMLVREPFPGSDETRDVRDSVSLQHYFAQDTTAIVRVDMIDGCALVSITSGIYYAFQGELLAPQNVAVSSGIVYAGMLLRVAAMPARKFPSFRMRVTLFSRPLTSDREPLDVADPFGVFDYSHKRSTSE